MTRAALSVYMYGLYLIFAIGLPFLLIPHTALGLVGLAVGEDLWVRFTGLLAGVLGGIYLAAVLSHTTPLFLWTVPARCAGAAFIIVMVVLDKAGVALLLFAALDAFSAAFTWLALRVDAEEEAEKARQKAAA